MRDNNSHYAGRADLKNMPIGGGCDVNRAGGNANLALICSKDVCMDITEPNRSSQKMTTNIDAILSERQKTHGDFNAHARITQQLKDVMVDSPNWQKLSCVQKESLEMVAHKFGRILAGDCNYIESWRDSQGYLQLVIRELEQTEGATDGIVKKMIVKNKVLTECE